MSALEAMKWQQDALERADKVFLALTKLEPVDLRPAPLQMTDTEVLDWMGEYCEMVSYVRPTEMYRGGFTLDVDGISPTKGATLREAVKLAAAKWKSVND